MYDLVEKKVNIPELEDWKTLNYNEIPDTSACELHNRINNLWNMEQAKDIECVIVYADREHYSNIFYFTDYEPRFEESLLFLFRNRKPIIVVGNEGLGFVKKVKIDCEVKLFQPFSLMGQPMTKSYNFDKLIDECRIPTSGNIGLIGWKFYKSEVSYKEDLITDIPYYIVRAIERKCGKERLFNRVDLLSDCRYGLKHHVTAEEIVRFEICGTKISRGVYNCIANLKEGISEIEASLNLDFDGEPLISHPMINFGDTNCSYGLASPTYMKKLERGEFVGIGYGLRGCLVHKVGVFASNRGELPESIKDYLEKMVKPYYASVVRWYEMMKIGTEGGLIWEMVNNWLGLEKFGIGLNPGHLTHTDEWTNSIFEKDCKVKITSGMAFQCDYTVTFNKPYMTSHVEDGLVIADKELCDRIKVISPTCWDRIEKRKAFMKNVLNIEIPDELLPMSDLPAVCFPWLADISTVLAKC